MEIAVLKDSGMVFRLVLGTRDYNWLLLELGSEKELKERVKNAVDKDPVLRTKVDFEIPETESFRSWKTVKKLFVRGE